MQKIKEMQEEDHRKRIGNTQRAIEDLKAELIKVAEQPDLTPKINEVNMELRRIQVDRARVEGEKADLRTEKDNLVSECRSTSLTTRCQHYSDCTVIFT